MGFGVQGLRNLKKLSSYGYIVSSKVSLLWCPNLSYLAATQAYARNGDVRGAEAALHEMYLQRLHPNVYAFNGVMAACARDGNMLSALRWFNGLQQACLAPDVVSFRTVISACARAGNLAVAEEWLSTMTARSHPLDVISCSSIIGGYAAAGDPAKAEDWLSRMLLAGIRPGGHAFNPVAS